MQCGKFFRQVLPQMIFGNQDHSSSLKSLKTQFTMSLSCVGFILRRSFDGFLKQIAQTTICALQCSLGRVRPRSSVGLPLFISQSEVKQPFPSLIYSTSSVSWSWSDSFDMLPAANFKCVFLSNSQKVLRLFVQKQPVVGGQFVPLCKMTLSLGRPS